MTRRLVKDFPWNGGTYDIEADASGASYFWGADWLLRESGSRVTVVPTPSSGMQADQKFLDLIAQGPWRPAYSRQTDLADSIMTAIVLAPFAPETTRFTELGRLRVQECERVKALRTELGQVRRARRGERRHAHDPSRPSAWRRDRDLQRPSRRHVLRHAGFARPGHAPQQSRLRAQDLPQLLRQARRARHRHRGCGRQTAQRRGAAGLKGVNDEVAQLTSLDKLKTVSTATAATALFKRGFRTQCIQNVHPLSPGQPVLVGPAFTLRYIPAREDLNKLDVFRDRSHPQRKAVEDCPPGAVMVMDSRKDARAASAGAILVTRMMKRGVAGVVTDGGFRDSAEIAALGIPAYHQRPSAPTNLTLHQAIDINVPIGCGDAPVFPGDIILGDQDGVIVIPANLLDEIADETFEMTAYEDFVTEQVRAGKGIFGLYPATDPQSLVDFAAWRKANGR